MKRSEETTKNSVPNQTAFKVLFVLSLAHLLNDTIQSLLPAVYPLLKISFQLSFTQIGLITFVFQLTASLLQPIVGFYNDRRPKSHALAFGMTFTLIGLILLALAQSFFLFLLAAALIGTGSSVFHPEASRLARFASGGKHGFAQSLFQVGGNLGSSFGPLLAAAIVVPYGQRNLLWFSLIIIIGIFVMNRVGNWYKQSHLQNSLKASVSLKNPTLPLKKIRITLGVLILLIFSKYFYLASLTNYYTFFLIHKFHVSIPQAQIYLFLFLFAVAVGTIIGGPVGDRFGRKYVIWFSIFGVAPFSLLLPYSNLFWTGILSIIIGLILASAFSAILVYALELVPNKVGLIAGLFFGFAFGIAGIASAVLGKLADHTSIEYVFRLCSFLPLLGVFTAFLPKLERHKHLGMQ